jgi:hypothetical protein
MSSDCGQRPFYEAGIRREADEAADGETAFIEDLARRMRSRRLGRTDEAAFGKEC